MIRVCPKCGAENGAASIHCRNCSLKLPLPAVGPMRPAPSLRLGSLLRSAFWALVLLAIGATGFWVSSNVAWRDVQSGAGGFYANWQNARAAVSGAMQRWHSKWLAVDHPPRSALNPPPGPALAITSTATALLPGVIKIRCKNCEGLGYTVIIEKKTTVDLAKKEHILTETKRVACGLCDQKGGRTVTLPPGAEICPACYGMGRTLNVFNGKSAAMQCNTCLGKGYIFRKY